MLILKRLMLAGHVARVIDEESEVQAAPEPYWKSRGITDVWECSTGIGASERHSDCEIKKKGLKGLGSGLFTDFLPGDGSILSDRDYCRYPI